MVGDDVTVGLESERKYDVPAPSASPDLGSLGFAARTSRFTLTATYFDTADGLLAANRMTLRRREGGHDEGWHLKTPGEGGRLEHHAPLSDGLPDSLRGIAEAVTAGRELVEFARLVTQRSATILLDAAGAEIVEIADDRVSAEDLLSGERRGWREWEAELLDGAPTDPTERRDMLDRVEAALLASGAVPSSAASKLARATGRAPLPGV